MYPGLDLAIGEASGIVVYWGPYDFARQQESCGVVNKRTGETAKWDVSSIVFMQVESVDEVLLAIHKQIDRELERMYAPTVELFADYLWSA
jgi:hypothetical protein